MEKKQPILKIYNIPVHVSPYLKDEIVMVSPKVFSDLIKQAELHKEPAKVIYTHTSHTSQDH